MAKDWQVERVEHTDDPEFPLRVIGKNMCDGGSEFRWRIPAESILNPRYGFRAAVFTEQASKIVHEQVERAT